LATVWIFFGIAGIGNAERQKEQEVWKKSLSTFYLFFVALN